MQISKLFSAVCAVAVCASFITVRADDNPAQAAARAALEETMRGLDAQQVDKTAVAPKAKVDEQKAAAEAKAKAEQQKADAAAKARADQQKAAAELKAKKETGEAKVSYPGNELKMEPIEAPPLPISSVKQTQLQALLAKYKAELITSGQYQTERTKILADP